MKKSTNWKMYSTDTDTAARMGYHSESDIMLLGKENGEIFIICELCEECSEGNFKRLESVYRISRGSERPVDEEPGL